MAARELDAIFYVKAVPEISFEEGTFRVSYDVGQKARFEFVFSPNTFLKMRRAAGRVVDEFERRGDVVGIKGRG